MFRRACVAQSWLLSFLASVFISLPAAARDGAWQIGKLSGEVWVSGQELQPVALDMSFNLESGHELRTGRTGRVLLLHGEQKILLAPNSVLALPTEAAASGKTIIQQRAGEIVLSVDKRNTPHFEVETPNLAALVKGTEFKVTVGPEGSQVDVIEGKVQVSDFKSGQFALVLPGQTAKVLPHVAGLNLAGSGVLSPIQQGAPRQADVTRVPVPKGGLSQPVVTPSLQEAGLGNGAEHGVAPKTKAAEAPGQQAQASKSKPLRIARPIGQARLDMLVATKGFARSNVGQQGKSKSRGNETVFGSNDLSPGNGASKEASHGNSGSGGNASKAASGSSSSRAAATANANSNAGGNGNGNGNGNGLGNGNGKGKGKGKGKA